MGYRVSVNGLDSGGAFAITDTVAVTAAHVIRKASSPSHVTLSEGKIPVISFDRDEELDLAALTLRDSVVPSVVADGEKGDKWAIHVPPKLYDPYLSGIVDVPTREFENAAGYPQRVMQLRVHQAVKGFEGYSGSAVYLPELEDAVIAILTEQQLERTRKTAGGGKPSATNVLYAVPVAEILHRFDLKGEPTTLLRTRANVTVGAPSNDPATTQSSVIADLIAHGQDIIGRLEAHILPSGEEKIPYAIDQRVTYMELDNWEDTIRSVLSAGFSAAAMSRYATIREVWVDETKRREGTQITRALGRMRKIVSLLQDLEV